MHVTLLGSDPERINPTISRPKMHFRIPLPHGTYYLYFLLTHSFLLEHVVPTVHDVPLYILCGITGTYYSTGTCRSTDTCYITLSRNICYEVIQPPTGSRTPFRHNNSNPPIVYYCSVDTEHVSTTIHPPTVLRLT